MFKKKKNLKNKYQILFCVLSVFFFLFKAFLVIFSFQPYIQFLNNESGKQKLLRIKFLEVVIKKIYIIFTFLIRVSVLKTPKMKRWNNRLSNDVFFDFFSLFWLAWRTYNHINEKQRNANHSKMNVEFQGDIIFEFKILK